MGPLRFPAEDARAARVRTHAVWLSLALHSVVAGSFAINASFTTRGPLTDVRAETAIDFTEPLYLDEPPPAEEPPAPAPVIEQGPPASAEPPPQADEDFGGEPPPPAPPSTIVDIPRAPEPSVRPVAPQPAVRPAPPPQPVRRAMFAGVEATPARRIVYLIDASGAMAASLNFVKAELAESVARLEEDQEFQVIVFRMPAGENATAIDYFHAPDGLPSLTHAVPAAKESVRPWLESIYPQGRSDPLLGLESAMRLSPDIVFVLSRGIQRSGVDVKARNREILDALDRINPRQPGGGRLARIKTIQFIDDDPTGLMQAIANEHGDGPASYRVVSRREVNAPIARTKRPPGPRRTAGAGE